MMATDAPDFPDLTVIDEVPSAPLPLVVTPPADRQAKPDIDNFRPGELDGTVQPKPLPDFLKPELTDPIAPISPTPYFADPIDRQFHYYGALIDHADAYKAANGRDPVGADLAAIQDRAAAEAFPPGEEPVALRPYAAPVPAPVGDGPAMSDIGEDDLAPAKQPASEPSAQSTGDQRQYVAAADPPPSRPPLTEDEKREAKERIEALQQRRLNPPPDNRSFWQSLWDSLNIRFEEHQRYPSDRY